VCQKTKDKRHPISEWALKMFTNSIFEEEEKEEEKEEKDELEVELRKKKKMN
jgi:hypothetical protein